MVHVQPRATVSDTSNGYLSSAYVSRTSPAWGHRPPHRHHVDDYYVRYAREVDSVKRKASTWRAM